MTASATRDVTIVACAVSAGMHAALTPEHFREGVGGGGGFLAATVLVAVLAVWLTIRPRGGAAPATAALVFGGLLLSYLLAVTRGIPLIHPEVEPVDGLALTPKLVEALGLLAGLRLAHASAASPSPLPNLKGVTQ